MGNQESNPELIAFPIRQVISQFADKWSLLVLCSLDASPTGVLRFTELHRQISDCSQKMLSQTLKNLQASHLINREIYPEVPPRVEYSLSDMGKSLMAALQSLINWAKVHYADIVAQ